MVLAGTLRDRGGPHPRYVFRGGRGLFLRPPHVRDFVKEGYFFVPRYDEWGLKIPLRNIRGSAFFYKNDTNLVIMNYFPL